MALSMRRHKRRRPRRLRLRETETTILAPVLAIPWPFGGYLLVRCYAPARHWLGAFRAKNLGSLGMIYETFDGLTDISHDVCIVGAGPVGISLAVELNHLGFSVLLLESGRKKRIPTSKNFPMQKLSLPRSTTT